MESLSYWFSTEKIDVYFNLVDKSRLKSLICVSFSLTKLDIKLSFYNHLFSWTLFWLMEAFDQGLGVMVFNITFNNISAVLWWPFYWWWKSEYPEKTTDLSKKKSVKSRMRETFIYLFIYLFICLFKCRNYNIYCIWSEKGYKQYLFWNKLCWIVNPLLFSN